MVFIIDLFCWQGPFHSISQNKNGRLPAFAGIYSPVILAEPADV